MSRPITLLVLSICLNLTVTGLMAQQSKVSKKCFDKARTQSELNECSGADAAAADRELNRIYQLILKKYADQPIFIKRLHEAQRAWLKYRDAQLEMKYPTSTKGEKDEKHETENGSVYPMCYASYKAELTSRRSKELREWLTGIEEGDVCAGSVKTPESLK